MQVGRWKSAELPRITSALNRQVQSGQHMDCATELGDKSRTLQTKPISTGHTRCQMPQFSTPSSGFFFFSLDVAKFLEAASWSMPKKY